MFFLLLFHPSPLSIPAITPSANNILTNFVLFDFLFLSLTFGDHPSLQSCLGSRFGIKVFYSYDFLRIIYVDPNET